MSGPSLRSTQNIICISRGSPLGESRAARLLSPNELRDQLFSWRPVRRGASQPQEPSSSMAHDVLWLSIRSDHPDEIAVHMEDGRNPDGSEAGNTGSRTWPCSCRASPSLVSPLGLARLRSPAHFLVPRRRDVSPVALGQALNIRSQRSRAFSS